MNPRFFGLGLALVLSFVATGGGARAQEERDIICTYTDSRPNKNPFIVEISKLCGDGCGGDLCLGRIECHRRGSSRIFGAVAYCPVVGEWKNKCPDATTCAYDRTITYKDNAGIIDMSQNPQIDSGSRNLDR